MKFSEQTDQLFLALQAAQKTVTHLIKDKKGHNYKYGDLKQLLELFEQHFEPQGFIQIQGHAESRPGEISATTRLIHVPSGQWIETVFTCDVDKQGGPQGAGSATTYARRYSLEGLMGIAHVDDDGQAAQKSQPKKQTSSQPQTQPQAQQPQVDEVAIKTELVGQIKAACAHLGMDSKAYAAHNGLSPSSAVGDLQQHVNDLHKMVERQALGTLSEAEQAAMEKYSQ